MRLAIFLSLEGSFGRAFLARLVDLSGLRAWRQVACPRRASRSPYREAFVGPFARVETKMLGAAHYQRGIDDIARWDGGRDGEARG